MVDTDEDAGAEVAVVVTDEEEGVTTATSGAMGNTVGAGATVVDKAAAAAVVKVTATGMMAVAEEAATRMEVRGVLKAIMQTDNAVMIGKLTLLSP